MTKEQIYDEQIAPLMTQIIAICKANKIAMIAGYSTPNQDSPDLICRTALLWADYEPPNGLLAANYCLIGSRARIQMTVEKGDGSKEITVIPGCL